MSRASQLFHTVVVVGTAAGCGSASERVGPQDGGAPRASISDAGPRVLPDCPSPAQLECDAATPGECACDLGAPLGICDCARPGEFRCRGCVSGSAIEGRCPLGDGVGCFCNTSMAVAAPADCPHPEQFTCLPPPPVPPGAGAVLGPGGWFDYAECTCDGTRPVTAADCTCQACSFECVSGTCPSGTPAAALSNVRFDCACIPTPVAIAR